jgi:hypothetical protein
MEALEARLVGDALDPGHLRRERKIRRRRVAVVDLDVALRGR